MLAHTGVTSLPAGLTKLKHLASLDVSGCPLPCLPTSLSRLTALRRLRLSSTLLSLDLTHTWECVGNIPRLESLDLR